MSSDDLLEALNTLRADAETAEPAASALVHRAAEAADGEVVRFETRFKSDTSIVAKLERFRRPRPPHYDLTRFNDALRYTVVIAYDTYWDGCLAAVDALGTDGFEVVTKRRGWRSDFAGMNLTVADGEGRSFEVQFHTPDSLATAEDTHPQYVEWRRMDRRTPGARFIRRMLDAAAARVPLPPGVPRV
jgi:hypothetical protein